MNIHPSFVVKKENGLYVGKTSNDTKSVLEAKIYPTEKLAKNSCYSTETVEAVSVPGEKIIIHRLYPTRWFQFDGELSGWAFRESDATLFASKDAAIACASEHNHDFKSHPERFCLEVYEEIQEIQDSNVIVSVFTSDDHDNLGTPENPIVNTYEYRGTQQSVLKEVPSQHVSGSLWFTPASQTSNESLAAAQIDYSITKEDLEKAVAKAHDRFFGKPPSSSESEKVSLALKNLIDALKGLCSER